MEDARTCMRAKVFSSRYRTRIALLCTGPDSHLWVLVSFGACLQDHTYQLQI